MKYSWLFRWWYVLKLRQQLNSPFKMKNETESIRSNCIVEIGHRIEPFFLSLKKLVYKLGVKTIQNNRSRLERNEINTSEVHPHPLFSQNQIATIFLKYWFNLFIIILLIVSEGFLYWVITAVFVPGGSELMKIAIAIFLALLNIFCIDYGLTQHFKYTLIKTSQLQNEKKVCLLKTQNTKRLLGYILIILSLLAILFVGITRIYFLEHIPDTGLSKQKQEAVQNASSWASWVTLIVTFSTAILLGMIKREQSKVAEKYNVLRYWNKALRRRNTYSEMLIENANKIVLETEKTIEKHFQLVVDLKRVFKMDQEYDAKYEQLNQEYLDAKNRPGFTINDFVYRKYSPIQSAHEELFRFGIYNADEIKSKLLFAAEIQKQTEDYLNEHINGIYQQDKEDETEKKSMNGKPSKQKLQTI